MAATFSKGPVLNRISFLTRRFVQGLEDLAKEEILSIIEIEILEIVLSKGRLDMPRQNPA